MIRTALVLIVALIIIPIMAFNFDETLSVHQVQTVKNLFGGMLGVALCCFVVSEWSRNYSQVDKLWSLVPIVYVGYVAMQSGWNERVTFMFVLATLWGARLTFNFARKGGYHRIPWKGEEDYRWAVLRQNPPLNKRLPWMAFNLFFISLYQNTLILLFTLPTIVAWQGEDTSLGFFDGLLAVLFLTVLGVEAVADQQQWNFQKEKYRRIKAGEPLDGEYAKGFVSTGLWSIVRHPNFAAEQMIWVVFYAFSVVATGRWINWSLAGVALLMLLFLGSADFTEKISAKKYPGYADYIKRVPRFWPGL